MKESILILDFGSQYTQLIARRIRELNVYCEIHPFNKIPFLNSKSLSATSKKNSKTTNSSSFALPDDIKGVILSGSPFSVRQKNAPLPDLSSLRKKLPILAVCYGAQLLAHSEGGNVLPSQIREYGRANLNYIDSKCPLFNNIFPGSQVWMSHGDTISKLPKNFNIISSTSDVKVAGFKILNEETYGIQFHPEVYHSSDGALLLKNFVYNICNCNGLWTPASFIDDSVNKIKKLIRNDRVVLGLSGGVDSTVAAVLLNKAIGKNLFCIFVDNGLLRKNEFNSVLHSYKDLGLNVKGVNAAKIFLKALKNISDPEKKRKIIGKTFIDVFDSEAHKIKNVKWLAQGTIYPDVIESVSVHGPSATIKSHHNVGGLPEFMKLKIIEPLNSLFKDEVRNIGTALGINKKFIQRHPFPGPGLAIRIISDVTPQKIKLLQEVDNIFIQGLKNWKNINDASYSDSLYDSVWQAAAMLLPVQSVGVMGDERTYQNVVALRAVTSTDGMTADWAKLPYDFLDFISNEIINKVKGVNRVVYDISSKPPSTIEWE